MRKTLAGGWHNSTGVCLRQQSELEILYRRRYSAPAFGPGSDRNGVVGVCVIYTGFKWCCGMAAAGSKIRHCLHMFALS